MKFMNLKTKFMKNLAWILLLCCNLLFSQKESEIEKILNNELKREIDRKINNPSFTGDTLIVLQPFLVKNNILSIIIKKKSYYDDTYIVEKQEVPLDKILTIIKDINILFETQPEAVLITQTDANGKISKNNYHLFFLHLSEEKDNEKLGDKIVRKFKKAGVFIEKSYWFD